MNDILIKIFLVMVFAAICYFILASISMDDEVIDMKKSHESMMQCIPSPDDKIQPLKQMFFCPSQNDKGGDEN